MSMISCTLRNMKQTWCVAVNKLLLQGIEPISQHRRGIYNNMFGFDKNLHILVAYHFELLENHVKTFLWVRKLDVQSIVSLMETTGIIKDINSSFMLNCCGRSMIDATTIDRSRLLYRIWSILKSCDHQFGIEDYNALLQGYLDNKVEFQLDTILTEMKYCGISPNYDTYKILINYCYQKDDIQTAITITRMMSKRMKIEHDIISFLIKMQRNISNKAEDQYIGDMIKGTDSCVSADIYAALIQDNIKKNNIEQAKKILYMCSVQNIKLKSQNTVDTIVELINNNNLDLLESVIDVTEITDNLISDMTLLHTLIFFKRLDYAMIVFKNLMSLKQSQSQKTARVEFFLSELVKNHIKIPVIVDVCDTFARKKYVEYPLFIVLKYLAMFYGVKEYSQLLDICARKGYPMRSHLFWPILSEKRLHYDCRGVLRILNLMVKNFNCLPCIVTLQMYICSFNLPWRTVTSSLITIGIPHMLIDNALVLHLLIMTKINQAANYMTTHHSVFWNVELQDALMYAFCTRNDVESYITICKNLYETNSVNYLNANSRTIVKVPVEAQLLHLLEFQPLQKHILKVLKKMSMEGIEISKYASDQLRNNLGKFIGDISLNNSMSKTSKDIRNKKPVRFYERNSQAYLPQTRKLRRY